MKRRRRQQAKSLRITAFLFLATVAICSPTGQQPGQPVQQPAGVFSHFIDPAGRTIASRIRTPHGFTRVAVAEDSFAAYLRQLPLKVHGATVRLYDGRRKENTGIYDAVVDLGIGRKNLHQCADAVIRLRAEYLYRHKQYEKIHFNFSSGFRAEYARWMKGNRIAVRGDTATWVRSGPEADSYGIFWAYLETVFSYAGTKSLERELRPTPVDGLQIGDVFIHGGSPGHAAIVVDLAVDAQRGAKMFLLAQSYMPAQEIHILSNPGDPQRSPWYAADFGTMLLTPEWTFRRSELRRFVEF